MMNAVAVLLFVVALFAALPIIIGLIYKYFYNRHLSRYFEIHETDGDDGILGDTSLMGDTGAKDEPGVMGKTGRWLSPFAVGLIVAGLEIILIIVACFMYSARKQSHSNMEFDMSGNKSEFYTKEEVENTPYDCFSGDKVSGYTLEKNTKDDFEYILYHNDGTMDSILPEYILLVSYLGTKSYGCCEGEITIQSEYGGLATGKLCSPSDRYIAVIDTQSIYMYDLDRDGNRMELSDEELASAAFSFALDLTLYEPDEETYNEVSGGDQEDITVEKVTIPVTNGSL